MKWITDILGAPDPASQDPTWRPLLGDVIELGATGFQIRLSHDPRMPTYTGIDPEGRTLTDGHNLEAMRQALETSAQWRREFEPPAGCWPAPR